MFITEKAKEFIGKYYFTKNKMNDLEELKSIIRKQGFGIFIFGEHELATTTELIKTLDLEEKRKENAFTYNSPDTKVVFLKEGLSNNEYAILLMHEEAHIFLGHLNENKKDTTIYDEEEVHAFIEEVKRQLDVKGKETKLCKSQTVLLVTNEGTKKTKHNLLSKNVAIAILLICVFGISAKHYIESHNTPNQQLETTAITTTVEAISDTVVETFTSEATITTMETTVTTIEATTTTLDTTTTTETETVQSIETTETEEQIPINDSLVYITKSGKKYHRADCYMITGKNVIALNIGEAQKLYEPCAICRPDEE